jgi:hypothetical protein
MEIRKGDCVLVNLAPFIGSARRNEEAVPCRVLAIDGPHVEVRPEPPYREFSLRVERTWIDGEAAKETALAAAK